jgi:hypothetical protein
MLETWILYSSVNDAIEPAQTRSSKLIDLHDAYERRLGSLVSRERALQ